MDPQCGDNVYTETLVDNPPDGVVYENYADALKRGALVEHACRSALRSAWKAGRGRFRETWTTAVAKSLNTLRRAGLLFWEPTRIFSVRSGEYDLIHVHVFSCGFRQLDCPVVVSNALPLRFLYTDARHYSQLRVTALEFVEGIVARIMKVDLTSYSLPNVTRVVAFSQNLAQWYSERRIVSPSAIDVVPIYLPAKDVVPGASVPRRIGFIAKDFAAKGGHTLLEAFEEVRRQRPDIQLDIVGCPSLLSDNEAESRGIRWTPYIPRERLLSEFVPNWDVFAYPTRFDGFPLVLLEAMNHGLAIAATDYRAIPEMLDYGRAGLLSAVGDGPSLAANLLKLLEPELNQRFRKAARQHFVDRYSADAVRPQLARSYVSAVNTWQNKAIAAASAVTAKTEMALGH